MVEIKIEDELKLEERLIATLTEGESQWTYATHIKTHDDLWMNFRQILERNNKDVLADVPLTESEFRQIQNQLDFASFYEAGKFLVGENGIAKVSVQREDASLGTIRLTVFKRQDVAGGSSVYQVINQFQAPKMNHMDRNARVDVTLLFNGLPLIHIELKKRAINHIDAFNQIQGYVATGKFRGLFSCLQCFVVSNGAITRYIAATDDNKLNKKFLTRWNDEENKPVDDLMDFAKAVLSIPQAHQLISFYSVLDDDGENIIILRPYQIHAIKALQAAASRHESGYIWHTTGSGKTLTSYKASRNLYQIPRIQKTIFLVDRVDLDQQTTNSFLSYAENDTIDIESTDNVRNLRDHLLSNDRSVVVTTIQKLNYLIDHRDNRLKDGQIDKLRKLQIAFVVDECHRAISPEQQQVLQKFFVNSLWYGFTGTPIFAENKKYSLGDLPATTEEQFGRRLHEYTVKEAIGDGAVLGFQVEHKDTIDEDGAYDVISHHHPDKDFYALDPYQREQLIPSLYYEREDHKLAVINMVVNKMVGKFALDRGVGKSYGAILTTSSIKSAQEYYRLFKEVKAGTRDVMVSDRVRSMAADFPKVAITYSISENKEMSQANYDQMKIALADYNEEYGTNFTLETISAYNRNLNERLARKKDKYRARSEQVDIVIVVDRLLTGFDAPSLGLLLIDRPPMTPQGLIQAFSRTNRLYDERKTYGQVVTFRSPLTYARAIEDAFRLYSNGGGNFVTAPDYSEAKRRFVDAADELLSFELTENPEVEMGYEKMVEFVRAFQKFDRANAAIKVYSDFEDDSDPALKMIDEKTLVQYLDLYNVSKALIDGGGGEVDPIINLPIDINYEPISVRSSSIDYAYLTNLMQDKARSRGNITPKKNEEIAKIIFELSKTNPHKGRIYEEINDEMNANPELYQDSDIEDVANAKINEIIGRTIKEFADTFKVVEDDFEFYVANFPIDTRSNSKPLGEDKLIKNADKDAYNEATGEGLSLLKFKSMLRSTASDFVKANIMPYFD